jgi:hypothetical protein
MCPHPLAVSRSPARQPHSTRGPGGRPDGQAWQDLPGPGSGGVGFGADGSVARLHCNVALSPTRWVLHFTAGAQLRTTGLAPPRR